MNAKEMIRLLSQVPPETKVIAQAMEGGELTSYASIGWLNDDMPQGAPFIIALGGKSVE